MQGRTDGQIQKLYKKNMDIVLATEAITQSVMLYAEEKGVRVSFTSTVPNKLISIDDEKYERIMLNLLSNAIKFTPQGKNITVEFSQAESVLCIKVKDEGVGIPAEKQGLIFEMFGQVDSSLTCETEGTGIGLALVKLLVNSMSGEVSVESKEGIGSTFTVILPEYEPSEEQSGGHSIITGDSRLIQATTIEFSNIYL